MILTKEYQPLYRDADENGRIGIRGYLNCFQDMATCFMHNLGKGNETLPGDFHVCWMFTKYHLILKKEADFSENLTLTTWVERIRAKVLVQQELIVSCGEEIYARGSLESCPIDQEKHHMTSLTEIGFPLDVEVQRGGLGFSRIGKKIEGFTDVYTHTVRYTDLDMIRHMTNLKYVEMFMNAMDNAFYDQYRIYDFELHYITQCFEGEKIRICKKQKENQVLLAAIHEDDSVAALCWILIEERA